jgi:hypothetical protein
MARPKGRAFVFSVIALLQVPSLEPQFDLNQAFRPGHQFHVDVLPGSPPQGGRVGLEQKAVGDLVLSSGRIVACDPLVFPEQQPFALIVSPGRYPVTLAVARIDNGRFSERRVICAKLGFGESSVVAWRNATPDSTGPMDWKPGQRFGYPVDSGTGCFMDSDAAEILIAERKDATDRWLQEGDFKKDVDLGSSNRKLNDALLAAGERRMRQPTSDFHDHCNVVVDEARHVNVIAFGSGWGDGGYESFWGFDSGSRPVCLVTDFGLFDAEVWNRN